MTMIIAAVYGKYWHTSAELEKLFAFFPLVSCYFRGLS